MEAGPIVRRKLADEVRDRLTALLRSGEVRPGDRLPSERELMARFQVGRPAVREAMQALQNAGLIEISHGERARVAAPDASRIFGAIGETALHLLQSSPETHGHLKQARQMFEVGMVRLAARHSTPATALPLRDAVQRMREAAASGEEGAFVAADMAFHVAIAGVLGNPIFSALSQAMLDWLFTFRQDMLRVTGAEALSLSEHARILDRILAHDEEGSAQAMTDHMSRSDKRYQALESAAHSRGAAAKPRSAAARKPRSGR